MTCISAPRPRTRSEPCPLAELTIQQAAQVAGCGEATIRNWIRWGRLKAAKVAGRWQIDSDELTIAIGATKGEVESRNGDPDSSSDMSREEFAAAAGVTPRQASRWKSAGLITGYNTAEAHQLAQAHVSLSEAKRRKETALAELAELKVLEAKGRLYQADEVDPLIRVLADTARAELQQMAYALPVRIVERALRPYVENLTDEDRAALEAQIRKQCIEYAQAAIARLTEVEL